MSGGDFIDHYIVVDNVNQQMYWSRESSTKSITSFLTVTTITFGTLNFTSSREYMNVYILYYVVYNYYVVYIVLLGTPKSKLEQPVQVLEQVFVQGMSVFLLTTNMRLFLNPIINDIFSPILICEKPFL